MNPKAPAFPAEFGPQGERSGLTIRDYIAIEAMKPLINTSKDSNGRFLSSYIDVAKGEGISFVQLIVRLSYEYADVLIAESNKKK